MISTGHLCSGYDGLGLALVLAGVGHRALWHAEVDGPAGVILGREHPDVRNVGDLTADIWHMAPHVDLMTAGFPCQPVSAAGRQLAENDPRWLWPGVLNVIRAVRPWRVFLENVQNIVSIQGGAILRLILDGLRDAGYASRWVVLGACAVGAPHHRHRWFLVADFVGAYGPDAVRVEPRAVCGAPRSGGRALLPRRRREGSGAERDRRSRTATGPTLGDVVALLPSPAARDGDGRGEGGAGFWAERATWRVNGRTLGAETGLLSGTWGKFADAIALWESITGTSAPAPTEEASRGGRRLSALLPEWMMGLPAGYLTRDATRREALKLAGNGVVPLQAAAAYSMLTS